jgi:hypothetical protein
MEQTYIAKHNKVELFEILNSLLDNSELSTYTVFCWLDASSPWITTRAYKDSSASKAVIILVRVNPHFVTQDLILCESSVLPAVFQQLVNLMAEWIGPFSSGSFLCSDCGNPIHSVAFLITTKIVSGYLALPYKGAFIMLAQTRPNSVQKMEQPLLLPQIQTLIANTKAQVNKSTQLAITAANEDNKFALHQLSLVLNQAAVLIALVDSVNEQGGVL